MTALHSAYHIMTGGSCAYCFLAGHRPVQKTRRAVFVGIHVHPHTREDLTVNARIDGKSCEEEPIYRNKDIYCVCIKSLSFEDVSNIRVQLRNRSSIERTMSDGIPIRSVAKPRYCDADLPSEATAT
jgi:hypothetical protein